MKIITFYSTMFLQWIVSIQSVVKTLLNKNYHRIDPPFRGFSRGIFLLYSSLISELISLSKITYVYTIFSSLVAIQSDYTTFFPKPFVNLQLTKSDLSACFCRISLKKSVQLTGIRAGMLFSDRTT